MFFRTDGSMTPAQCRARGQALAQQCEELERLRSAFLLDCLDCHSAPTLTRRSAVAGDSELNLWTFRDLIPYRLPRPGHAGA
jgi:hypothetical protein